MAIEYCPICHGSGYMRKIKPVPGTKNRLCPDWYEADVVCEQCNGAKKWRPAGESFTPLDQLDRAILEDMARVRPWIHLRDDVGVVHFISGLGIPRDIDNLIELLQTTSCIGKALEAENWLVYY